MGRKVNLAIVGATGAVGEAILSILQERKFPIDKLFLLASERSVGKTVRFNKQTLFVEDLAQFDFSKVEIALFSAGSKISEKYAPVAASENCVVIDNTSQFRYEAEIPLVVPEVNAQELEHFGKHNIIANPNCSTIQMVVALKPIYDAVGIQRINIATYQSVSGAGKKAISELVKQIGELLNGRAIDIEVFSQQIAFNVLPHIDNFESNGYTREEMKMVWETRKIFNDNRILVNPTSVRVPVIYGHGEAIHIETNEKITADKARLLLKKAQGVKVIDSPNKKSYPTPISHGAGKDFVYVGRIREDISHPRGLNMWVVADNIRKGAALNAVQIAEILLADYL